MTMYYSKAEMDYVEFQRMKRILENASSLELVRDEYGISRYVKDGEYWQPDMSDLYFK